MVATAARLSLGLGASHLSQRHAGAVLRGAVLLQRGKVGAREPLRKLSGGLAALTAALTIEEEERAHEHGGRHADRADRELHAPHARLAPPLSEEILELARIDAPQRCGLPVLERTSERILDQTLRGAELLQLGAIVRRRLQAPLDLLPPRRSEVAEEIGGEQVVVLVARRCPGRCRCRAFGVKVFRRALSGFFFRFVFHTSSSRFSWIRCERVFMAWWRR